MKGLRQMPFLRLVIPFVLGILLSLYWNWWHAAIAWCISIFLLFLILLFTKKGAFKTRWLFGFCMTLLMFFLGYCRSYFYQELNLQNHFGRYISDDKVVLKGEIYEMPQVNEKRIKVYLSIEKIGRDTNDFRATHGNVLVYIQRDSLSENLAYGDKIICYAGINELENPKNPNVFNYKKYLHYKNIHYQTFLKENEWREADESGGFSAFKLALQQRKKFLKILRQYLPDSQNFSVGSALILGYKDEMNEEVRTAYAQTGAMHVLAVSGLHVGLIYLLIGWLFDKIIPIKSYSLKILRGILCLCSVWIFALLTGMSPSVMRAATMFSVIIFGNMSDRNANIYNSLAVSAFILLLLQPLYIMNVGFQLSYLAVTGIVYFQPKIYNLYFCENKIYDFFWQLCTVSIAAQFFTLPLSLYYFHQFPIYFWLSGLIVVPAAGFILSGGLLVFFLETIQVGLGAWIGNLLDSLIWVMNSLIFLLQKIPGSTISGIWITGLAVLILYLAIAFFITAINTRRGKNLTIGLSLLSFAFTLSAIQKSVLINNQQIIVYDIYKNTLIECLYNNSAYAFKNKDLTDRAYAFSTQNNHYAHNVNKVEVFHIDDFSYKNEALILERGFLKFKDKTFFLLTEMPNQNSKITEVDYLIIYGNPQLSFEKLKEKFSFKKVIFDNSNSRYKVQVWITYCENNGINYHYTATDGAWILDL